MHFESSSTELWCSLFAGVVSDVPTLFPMSCHQLILLIMLIPAVLLFCNLDNREQ